MRATGIKSHPSISLQRLLWFYLWTYSVEQLQYLERHGAGGALVPEYCSSDTCWIGHKLGFGNRTSSVVFPGVTFGVVAPKAGPGQTYIENGKTGSVIEPAVMYRGINDILFR